MSLVETARDSRGVVTVTLADEANRNALSRRLLAELAAALDDADSDPDVRAVVLTNAGRVFCAGADLRESSAPADDNPVVVKASDLFGRFRRSPKPYVGRIAGHCVAGGMGLAAAMDVSIARDDAKFGFTEVRVGVAPAMISVLCLPKMRRADAAEAFLRGNRFTAAEAARLGLINAAVPADDLDDAVEAVVTDLLAGGPSALAAAKQIVDRVPDMSIRRRPRLGRTALGRAVRRRRGGRGHGRISQQAHPQLGARHRGGPMTEILNSLSAMTPDWLEGALTEAGHAPPPVSTVDVRPMDDFVGAMGEVGIVSVAYAGETDLPEEFVAKCPLDNDFARQNAQVMLSYQRENGFYAHMAAEVGARTSLTIPKCFVNLFDPETHAATLLIERIHPAGKGDILDGTSFERMHTLVGDLARMHGAYWMDESLTEHDWLIDWSAPSLLLGIARAQASWAEMREQYPQYHSDELAAMADVFLDDVPSVGSGASTSGRGRSSTRTTSSTTSCSGTTGP